MSVCHRGHQQHHHHNRNNQNAVTPQATDSVVDTTQRREHVQAKGGVVIGNKVAHVVAGEDSREVHPEAEKLHHAAVNNTVSALGVGAEPHLTGHASPATDIINGKPTVIIR